MYFLFVFVALKKQDKEGRSCSVPTKALHKTSNILHLTHVAIPTGRGGGKLCDSPVFVLVDYTMFYF